MNNVWDFVRFKGNPANDEAEIAVYVNCCRDIVIEADNPRLTCLRLSRTLSCDEVKQLIDYLKMQLKED